MQKFILPFLCAGIAGTMSLSAQEYKSQRPAEQDRLFRSEAVEAKILEVQRMLTNPRLAWMFANCFPNTLDTTVHFRTDEEDGMDDTFVYTGDIHAMWLRDSGAQVWPYVQLANDDEALRRMIAGVINRQFKLIGDRFPLLSYKACIRVLERDRGHFSFRGSVDPGYQKHSQDIERAAEEGRSRPLLFHEED